MVQTHNHAHCMLLLDPDLLDEVSIEVNVTGGLTEGT